MLFLTIRTDKPEAEIGLFNNDSTLAYHKWLAHRKLAETIHNQIEKLLSSNNLGLEKLDGIVIYQGPGSFTGLRIGISVANALADALKVPIVGVGASTSQNTGGNNDQNSDGSWYNSGLSRLIKGENDQVIIPIYGAEAKTTEPKK